VYYISRSGVWKPRVPKKESLTFSHHLPFTELYTTSIVSLLSPPPTLREAAHDGYSRTLRTPVAVPMLSLRMRLPRVNKGTMSRRSYSTRSGSVNDVIIYETSIQPRREIRFNSNDLRTNSQMTTATTDYWTASMHSRVTNHSPMMTLTSQPKPSMWSSSCNHVPTRLCPTFVRNCEIIWRPSRRSLYSSSTTTTNLSSASVQTYAGRARVWNA